MPKTTTAAKAVEKTDGEVQITELVSIEPTRVDGVGSAANGFPILMMKSLAPVPVEKVAAGTSCGCGPDCDCAKAATKTKKKAKKAKAAGEKTAKSATMPEGGANTSSTADITSDVIAKAVAEATAPIEAELTTLREQMAKVLNTPIPGGPVLVTPQAPRSAPSLAVEKAERFRAIANQTSDPETRASYLALAAREEGAPITKE